MELSQDDLTAKQTENGLSKWAVFLPAISGFYATFIGKQRNEQYVDPTRFPQGLTDIEQLNWLNASKGLFTYKWSLYSGGHANLDLSKQDWSEDMVRSRDPNTFMLGDSGGFQIAKGLWPGEWRDPTSVEVQSKLATLKAQGPITTVNTKGKTSKSDPAAEYQKLIDAAQKKRESVLKWLDGIANYGMILDIPTWVIHDKKASAACGITTLEEAVAATKYNNLYFMAHRKGKNNGGAKFLNVLQGDNHTSADAWYHEMKEFCDPNIYPETHFDGWAMGGQNMCDVHLVLKRLVALRYDNLLQEGKHDWMHFLGTSKLEWAVLLTVIQQSVRKYVNPNFTISFDCASPFLATANGQVYHHIDLPHQEKWCYRMSPSVDDKKYATDTRPYKDVIINDGFVNKFDESPISKLLKINDICVYGNGIPNWTEVNNDGIDHVKLFNDPALMNNPKYWIKFGDKNKNDKVGTTSWDSFSYALLMGHNVWTHIEAVQRANIEFAAGKWPYMMQHDGGDYEFFADIVDRIFAAPTQEAAMEIINDSKYARLNGYWNQIIGTRGFKGKKTVNSNTMFNVLYDVSDSNDEYVEPDLNEEKLNHLGES